MKDSLPLLLLLLLVPPVSPNPVLSPQALLEILEEDLAALLQSGNEEESPPAAPQQQSWSRLLRATGQRDPHPPAGPSPDPVWMRFFSDFVTNQKKFRGRTKKMAQQGCFGMKLDRIGTLSGLGC